MPGFAPYCVRLSAGALRGWLDRVALARNGDCRKAGAATSGTLQSSNAMSSSGLALNCTLGQPLQR
ncbi:hypothetical protein ACT43E_20825 (plasmid) [Acinetobacter baumannii]